MRTKLTLIIALLLSGILSLEVRGADAERVAAMEGEIMQIFRDLDMSGLGIAVVKDDSIIYQQSFGYRVLPDSVHPEGEPLENDDIFRIASVSKSFIATAIMQLVDAGRLRLDDDAEAYLPFRLRNPKYPDVPITIQQLFTHTSSINDKRSWWNIDYINPESGDEYKQCYSDWAPGNGYVYCNMNYTLLGAVIEGVTGERFDKVVKERILDPLGIGGSFNVNLLDPSKFVQLYWCDEKTGEKYHSEEAYKPYRYQIQDTYKLGKSLGLEYPASGMKISSGDLARFMMMFMYRGELDGVRLLSEKSVLEMEKDLVPGHNYGLSLRQYKGVVRGRTLHGQTGGGHGNKTCMIYDPEHKIGFVVLSAGADTKYIDGYEDIHRPIMWILYKYLLKDEQR